MQEGVAMWPSVGQWDIKVSVMWDVMKAPTKGESWHMLHLSFTLLFFPARNVMWWVTFQQPSSYKRIKLQIVKATIFMFILTDQPYNSTLLPFLWAKKKKCWSFLKNVLLLQKYRKVRSSYWNSENARKKHIWTLICHCCRSFPWNHNFMFLLSELSITGLQV